MILIDILFISVGLAMDAFAVALGAGSLEAIKGFRPNFRLSFHFGLFQFFMPIIGWLLGSTFSKYIESVDHWIALSILSIIGIRMIIAALKYEEEKILKDPSKGMTMVMLSVATSIDALAVGLSLAMLEIGIWYPCIIIGIVTAVITLIGLRIGNQLGKKFGKTMEFIGGLILIGIGIKILIQHIS
jgi:putative Mn2+ efflux pump MntP